MSEIPSSQATQPDRPSAPNGSFVRAWLLAMLETLFLSFRVRLPAGHQRRLARGDALPPTFLAAFAPDAPAHAPAIALGLVGDWILRCFPNRGMRRTPALRPISVRRKPARAPPPAAPPVPPHAAKSA